MTAALTQAEVYLDTALKAIREGDGFRATLDGLPVPVYLTDTQGAVTYWNDACIAFAGRQPELGKDRWCVTWQLYTMAGEPLPHDKCPMAEAILRREPIRDSIAIAERPDGSRVAFRPYPTPLFDDSGEMTGAVNMLIDISDEQADVLSDQAARCRRLAGATHDRQASEVLDAMAANYASAAAALRAASDKSC